MIRIYKVSPLPILSKLAQSEHFSSFFSFPSHQYGHGHGHGHGHGQGHGHGHITHLPIIRNYSVAREARFMKKLVTGSKNSKRKWFGGEMASKALTDLSFLMTGPPGGEGSAQKQKSKSGRTLRRVGVLSTIFMEQITSLLATGEVSTEILGAGLEITQVKISPEFNCINVYWYSSSGSENKKEDLEPHLKSIAGQLRHLLSQLRVIGQVPPIVFVKDDKHLKLMEVENILAKIDFGDEHEPTPLGHNYKSTMSSQTRTRSWGRDKKGVSRKLSQELETLEDDAIFAGTGTGDDDKDSGEEKESQLLGSDSCKMRQDMLGLNWEKIMNKVKLEVARTRHKESRTRVINFEGETAQSGRSKEEILGEVTQSLNRQKEFLDFLKQRRIMRAKDEKRMSTASKEREFLEQEKLDRWLHDLSFEIPEPKDQEDYIEEFEDEKKSGIK